MIFFGKARFEGCVDFFLVSNEVRLFDLTSVTLLLLFISGALLLVYEGMGGANIFTCWSLTFF